MDDLDARVDALFAGAPEDFTGGRDALAKELRAAGEREAAERVRALRRPSRLAADLNRLVREDRGRAQALAAAEEALAAAQARVLAGEAGAAELRDAERAEAEAIGAFPGGPGIHAALRFAARSTTRREELWSGRLSRDPGPEHDGDGLFAFGVAPTEATPVPAPAPPPARPPAAELAARAARAAAALEAMREAERDALDAAAAARERADEADAEAERRAAERERLREELARAEEAVAAAEAAARQARAAAEEARAAADEAGRARRAAEATARALPQG